MDLQAHEIGRPGIAWIARYACECWFEAKEISRFDTGFGVYWWE